MTHYEMAEKLSEKANVTLEEAKMALEACDWDLLDAALLLEKENGGEKAEYTTKQEERKAETEDKGGQWKMTLKNIGRLLAKLIACGNRNRFEVAKKGETVLELPITVLVVMMIFAFWLCVPLLVVGLFTGFRYSFSGPEFGREAINHVMDQAAGAAEKVKEEFKNEH